MRDARAERDEVATPRMTPESRASLTRNSRLLQALFIVLPLSVAVIAGDSYEQQQLGVYFILGSMAVAIAGFLYLQRRQAGDARPLAAPNVGSVVCSMCGSTQVYVASGLTSACRSCGAPLLPTPAVIARVEHTLADMVFRERMNRWKIERAGLAKSFHDARFATSTQTVVAGSLFSAGLLVIAVRDRLIHEHSNLDDNRKLIALACFIALVSVAGVVRRWRRSQAWNRVISTLITEHGAVPVSSSAWIDTRWAGPITPEVLYGDWAYHALWFRIEGYEALLILNTVPVSRQKAHIVVLLGAWVPGVSDRDAGVNSLPSNSWMEEPGARELHKELASWGFDVEVLAPGIMASANRERVDHVARRPERAVELAAVVDDVVKLARVINAIPVSEEPA